MTVLYRCDNENKAINKGYERRTHGIRVKPPDSGAGKPEGTSRDSVG